MKKYKAIISDIDGTIVPDDPHALPNKIVKDVIKKAQEKLHFILATGRPLSILEYLFEDMNYTGLAIIDNGAVIYDVGNKKILWESVLGNQDANNVLKIALKYNKEIGISTADGRKESMKHIDKNTYVRKFCIVGMTHSEADNFIKTIEKKLKHLSVVRASSYKGKDFLDIYVANKDATKQHAVLKIKEILKISTEEIIGIGDHHNDIPLLSACGLKIAMGNSIKEIKAMADYVAPTVQEDGLVDVIEKFVLNS